MPFYDYVCQACGRRIEVMHGVHATGPTRCDACGEGMQSMGHCKWLCRACGFLRTCIDTV